MLDPTAMILARKATQRHVTSARPSAPSAPTGPDRPARLPRADAGRALIATMLRRLANRVEPRTVQTCHPTS